ncbi:UDP-2,3-diacylglucosamine diphosphatase [Thalassotalea ganghwensis]
MAAHYRTVWLSDIHLGCKDCKAAFLIDFLKHTKIDTLFLVGDIIDMWAMSKQFRWPALHNDLFHLLLSLPQKGTRVIYLPGNHDEPLKKYADMNFADIEIHQQYVHTTANNKKLIVLHGDQFDQEVCLGKFHAWLGDTLYDLLLFINRWYNWLQSKRGRSYWSLSSYIKSRVKGANLAIARYREACCDYAKARDVDGIVCGHIHHPEIIKQDNVLYLNDGDWIENCSALTEDHQGELSLLFWRQISATHPINKPIDSHESDKQKIA